MEIEIEDGTEVMVVCPWCDGEGNEQVEGSDPHDVRLLKCHLCDGDGSITTELSEPLYIEHDLKPARMEGL